MFKSFMAWLTGYIKSFFKKEETRVLNTLHSDFAPGVDEAADMPASTTVPTQIKTNA